MKIRNREEIREQVLKHYHLQEGEELEDNPDRKNSLHEALTMEIMRTIRAMVSENGLTYREAAELLDLEHCHFMARMHNQVFVLQEGEELKDNPEPENSPHETEIRNTIRTMVSEYRLTYGEALHFLLNEENRFHAMARKQPAQRPPA